MASACGKMGAKAKKKKPPQEKLPVRATTLAKSTYQRSAHAVATVYPWREVSLRAEAPGRILGIKHEVGDLVVFFSSHESSYVTGQIITIDGGRECRLPTVIPVVVDENEEFKEIISPKEMLLRIAERG